MDTKFFFEVDETPTEIAEVLTPQRIDQDIVDKFIEVSNIVDPIWTQRSEISYILYKFKSPAETTWLFPGNYSTQLIFIPKTLTNRAAHCFFSPNLMLSIRGGSAWMRDAITKNNNAVPNNLLMTETDSSGIKFTHINNPVVTKDSLIVENIPKTISKFDYINCGPMPDSINKVELYDYDVLYLANMFCLQNIIPKYLNIDGYAQFTGSSRRKIFKQDYVFIYLLKCCFKRVVVFRTKVFMCLGFKGVPQSILNIKGYADIKTNITPLRRFVRNNIKKIDIMWKSYIANNNFKGFFHFVHTCFLENKRLLNLYIDLIDNDETLFAIRQVKKNPNRINQYLRAGINDEEGKYLFNLVITNKCKKLIEVGMANGVSAAYMTAALKELKGGLLMSIDPYQYKQWKANGLDLISTMKAKSYHELVEEKSYDALPKLLKKNKGTVDLVFVDGWHTFDYTLVDIFYSVLLLRIGGILVIDDALHPGVANTLRYLDKNYTMLRRLVSPPSFGAYQKTREDTRDWDFHKNF